MDISFRIDPEHRAMKIHTLILPVVLFCNKFQNHKKIISCLKETSGQTFFINAETKSGTVLPNETVRTPYVPY